MYLATDRPHALRQAISACRKGGTVSIPGVYGGWLDKFPLGAAFAKGLTLKMGQTHMHKYLPPLLERIERGEIDPSFIITHRVTLDDAPEMYRTFRDKEDGCIKVVMRPGVEATRRMTTLEFNDPSSKESVTMAETGTLHDAFIDELRDTYDAEKQLTKALPKLAKAATSPDLREAFESHLEETQGRSSGSSRCSTASTRRCAASTATGSRASSKKASPSWRRISTRPRWMPA